MNTTSYQIKLPQFEGPFDLLLFFIERDEIDIYNIPITKITNDFLSFIQTSKTLNIELSSEFILFISTLMRIKARLLLPRKEKDAHGAEIDPRQELVDKILEYKKFKEAAARMAQLEANRMLLIKRGNLQQDLLIAGEQAGEGTEIQAITLFKLMKAFEKVMQKLHERNNKPVHTVVQYHYTPEGCRDYIYKITKAVRKSSFESLFKACENRIHAIFLFLSVLELVQLKQLAITIGDGRNDFQVEYLPGEPEEAPSEETVPA